MSVCQAEAGLRIPACLSSAQAVISLGTLAAKISAAGISGYGTATVTRRKVAGMEVVFVPGLLF
jgi:hypothetical protein